MSDYLPAAWDAYGDSDDETITYDECIEAWDWSPSPLDILIASEARMVRIVAVEARSTFHRSPVGGSYGDRQEADRCVWARMAAQARREAWAERHAAMIEDTDRHT